MKGMETIQGMINTYRMFKFENLLKYKWALLWVKQQPLKRTCLSPYCLLCEFG